MMPTKTWKKKETQVARFFGSERTPLSGGNSKHTRSDSLSETFFVECKYRARQAVWTLYNETDKLADKEGKIPVLALCQKQEVGFLVVVHSKNLKIFCEEFLKEEKE